MPLLVRPWENGYQIISGHRRRAALDRSGIQTAMCEVREMDDESAFKALMVTNIQAQTLSEIEEAEGIKRMMSEYEWKQERVAREFGKSQDWISLRLRLLSLASPVQDMLTTRVVNSGQVRHIAKLPTEHQAAVAKKVAEQELPTRETEKLVKLITDPYIPEDLKQIAINEPGVTVEHIEAVMNVRNQKSHTEQAEPLRVPETRPSTSTERALKVHDFMYKLYDVLSRADDAMVNDLIELGRGGDTLNAINKSIEKLEEVKQRLLDRALDSSEKVVPIRRRAH